MDKVDSVIQGLLKFLKDFFKTYRDTLISPAKFFETAMTNDDKPEGHLNSVPYMLLSTFFLIYTVNVQKLSNLAFKLHSPGLTEVLNTFLNAEAKQVIVVTLPVSAFVYIGTKAVSWLSGSKNINRILMYWAGTCFITYFLSYVLLILLSTIIKFSNEYWIEISQAEFSPAAVIVWSLLIGIWIYIMAIPLIGIIKTVKTHLPRLRKKIVVYLGIIVIASCCIYIADKQEEFDPVFNPLKSYELKYSFLTVSGDTVITMSDILRETGRQQGGTAGSEDEEGNSRAIEGNTHSLEYPKKITIDAIVENNSPELIILRPNSCITFTVTYEKAANKIAQGSNTFALDMLCKDISTAETNAMDNSEIRERLMLFPAERQWLRLTATVEVTEFDKLNNMYYDDSLNIKKSPVFYLELHNSNSIRGKNVKLTSKKMPLCIRNFVPDKQRYDSLKYAN